METAVIDQLISPKYCVDIETGAKEDPRKQETGGPKIVHEPGFRSPQPVAQGSMNPRSK